MSKMTGFMQASVVLMTSSSDQRLSHSHTRSQELFASRCPPSIQFLHSQG